MLSLENFVHYKNEQILKLRRELGDFEQQYKAWIIWTIVTPEDLIKRAHVTSARTPGTFLLVVRAFSLLFLQKGTTDEKGSYSKSYVSNPKVCV